MSGFVQTLKNPWVMLAVIAVLVAYRLLEYSDIALGGPTTLDLGDYVHVEQTDRLYLHLGADKGWEYFGTAAGPNYTLECNLPHERRRSCYVIQKSEKVSAKALKLTLNENTQ